MYFVAAISYRVFMDISILLAPRSSHFSLLNKVFKWFMHKEGEETLRFQRKV